MYYIKLMVGLVTFILNYFTEFIIKWIIGLMGNKRESESAYWRFLFSSIVTSFTTIVLVLLLGGKLDFVPYIGEHLNNGKNRDFT